MDEVKDFLESTTIHGLTYISTTRTLVRVFWIIVVIFGFSTASFLIYQSFQAWEESPVSTTIETLPITKIKFPKVTVCPPKNTFTDLNYDLMELGNKDLDNDTRISLKNNAVDLLYDNLHESIMKNLSLLEHDNAYYNWYHAYTDILLPSQKIAVGGFGESYDLSYSINTYALNGSISSQYFGDDFDAKKVASDNEYVININVPYDVTENYNVTMHIEIEKISIRESGSDQTFFQFLLLPTDLQTYKKVFSPPKMSTELRIQRKISKEDVSTLNMKLMPGFKIKWHHTGYDQSQSFYSKSYNNRLFSRYYFIKHKLKEIYRHKIEHF